MKLVVLELGRGAGELDAADLEQIGAVDDLEHLLHVLLDDQHGQPFGADAPHQLEHLLHDQRRQAGGRLVHQQQLRLRHQRAADGAHLLLAAGERAGQLLAAVLQAREKARRPSSSCSAKRRRACGMKAPMRRLSSTRQPRKQPPVLRHVGDALLDHAVRRQAADRRALRSVIAPARSGSRPEMTRISVVLPAPFGPITPTASPCGTSSDTSNRALERAVAGGDGGERQHRGSASLSCRDRPR